MQNYWKKLMDPFKSYYLAFVIRPRSPLFFGLLPQRRLTCNFFAWIGDIYMDVLLVILGFNCFLEFILLDWNALMRLSVRLEIKPSEFLLEKINPKIQYGHCSSFFSKIIYDWNNFDFISQIEKSLGAHKNFFFGIFLYFFFPKFIISHQKIPTK